MQDILRGLRVLELGQVLAGPFAGAIFADLGAEVIKVERLDGGDDARRMGAAFRGGDSLIFQVFNRGKQSVALDLKSEEGRLALEQLLATADVLVHNLRPGVTDALGIAGPDVCARHPRLVYCEISAFGATGPMRMRPGYEPLVQAFSGLSAINGGPDDPPMRAGASLCDQGSGMWAVIGALALLQRRQHTGRGGIVATSLLEAAMGWNSQKVDALVNEGRQPDRHRSGHPGFVPYEAFDTADAPLLVCCGNDRLFAKLANELGRPQWTSDERFATNRARLEHKAQLFAELVPLLQARPRAEWLDRLERAGVPCAPIHSLPEAVAHPQVQALGILQSLPQEGMRLTALPFTVDGQRPALTAAAPRLGEHNARHGLAPLPNP
ncbi:CaiB/BaiF CoA transferase family protein [Ramlibacter sp. Leaf400]|uniref:CaiB/BaiF CoA transferase family protein n=1 Tax=Ramlibacter sp. Leaf400 TaxID=1736365 RepID=UPI0006F310FB|nr:CoA transferase [Ramlibacter sp. Leaf400]KQT09312.1 carnitine dehydratase [Ramlibacter sp. Leaf400]